MCRSLRRLHDTGWRRALAVSDGVSEAQADDAEADAVPALVAARFVPAAERTRARARLDGPGGERGGLLRKLDHRACCASALSLEGCRAAALLLRFRRPHQGLLTT